MGNLPQKKCRFEIRLFIADRSVVHPGVAVAWTERGSLLHVRPRKCPHLGMAHIGGSNSNPNRVGCGALSSRCVCMGAVAVRTMGKQYSSESRQPTHSIGIGKSPYRTPSGGVRRLRQRGSARRATLVPALTRWAMASVAMNPATCAAFAALRKNCPTQAKGRFE